jgi:protein BCP1
MAPPSKKSKKGKEMDNSSEVFYFQSEDEIIAQYAEYQFDYKFTNNEKEQAADSRRAFSEYGIAPFRRLMFVHASKFDQLVSEIKTTCSSVTAA